MTLIGVLVVLLYASRACYNLVVLALTNIETINSFDYDWYNVSDQVRMTRYPRHRMRERREGQREKNVTDRHTETGRQTQTQYMWDKSNTFRQTNTLENTA